MNKKYKFTALSLGLLTLATVGLTSCNQLFQQQEQEVITPTVNPEHVYDGTHIYTATNTNQYLVKNGKTEYTLVIPQDYSSSLRIARTEFVDLFEDATGIALNVVTDDTVANASQGKYISLGETTLLQDSGIAIDHETLTADGHRIVTKEDDIYLCGGADEGTVFAVYTFMRLTFNFETYYYDCMEIEHTTEKKLKNYDVTDIPDFKYRAHSSDVSMYESGDYDENMFAWRLNYYGKEGTRGYYFMPVHEYIDDFSKGKKSASTNARRWFPEHMYKDVPHDSPDYHPGWFSDNGGEQLCFSAHGDPKEYELMVETAYKKVEAHLKYYTPDEYPRYKIMTLTHMDNTDYCTCDACREISEYYGGSQAAVQVLFMNDLAEKVDKLLEDNKDKDWYREDFQLLFFAYNHNYEAPARYDAVKKEYVPIEAPTEEDEYEYVPANKSVVLHNRVIAWFCRNANGQDVFDENRNTSLKTTLAGWASVAEHIYYWSYGTSFRNYMMPLDHYQYATPEMFAYFCNQSDEFWFTQLQDNNKTGNTAWNNLKIYLEAKLAWDTSLNPEELVENWMHAMYKDAAPTMLRLFQTVRAYQQHVLIGKYSLESNGDGSPEMALPEYWPIGMLEGWIDKLDTAKAEIARFAVVDPELYETVCQHIEIEAISSLYLLLELHSTSLSYETREKYINRVEYDIEWMNIGDMEIRNGLYLGEWVVALQEVS